ncbi:phosphoadenosine phosphosulfate reductase family protein [Alishewanella sp. SMS9]|nr:phosphoadenosine phosphosulfate reductase family protein [Alishewanella sp. SMS9]
MIRCVVPVSGGKDSQACLQLAIEQYGKKSIVGLFNDTKFEHPETYKHIEFMQKFYGVKIHTVNNGDVLTEVEKAKRFPGATARFCTDRLKLRPSREWYRETAKKQGGFVVFLGVRSEESAQRAKRYDLKLGEEEYAPHEVISFYPKYLFKMGVRFRLPVLDWTTKQIFDYLGGKHNPLYNVGFERVGCFPCLAGGDPQKEKAFAHDKFGREQRIKVAVLEESLGKSIFTSKAGTIRNNKNQLDMFGDGCRICSI